jgi:hypothetical protein
MSEVSLLASLVVSMNLSCTISLVVHLQLLFKGFHNTAVAAAAAYVTIMCRNQGVYREETR